MIKALRLSLLLTLIVVTAYYAKLHFGVLQISHPITQDEPCFIEITAAGNPYTLANVQPCGSVYGPGYSFWAKPFTAVIANPYAAHRWATSFALFAMLAVLAWSVAGEGIGCIEIAAGIAIVYILNVSSHSLSASPDFLGAALYVAALALSQRGTWPALLSGLIFAILGTLTKPYFALSWVIIASHCILFQGRRKALVYLGLSTVFGLVTFGTLLVVAPYYFLSTFTVHSVAAARRLSVLIGQSTEFTLLTCGILTLGVLRLPRKRTVAFHGSAPLVSPPIDLWSWAALVAAVALLGSLGWHPGNYLVYYYHLLLGPLVVVALRNLRAWPRVGRALLCVNLLVLGYLLPPQPGSDNWTALAAEVEGVHGKILAEPLLEPFARALPNVELLSHGQTASILGALDHLRLDVPARYAELNRALVRNADETAARIRAGEFAAVFVSYHEINGYTVWTYDNSRILKALFTRYIPTEEVAIYPYGTPYWDRMHHGQRACRVVRWDPRPVVERAKAPARPQLRGK